jgi:hypothetical protein
VGSLENLAGGEVLRRTSTAVVPSSAPGKLTVNRTADEWEQKLYGKQGKGKIVYLKVLEDKYLGQGSKSLCSSHRFFKTNSSYIRTLLI